MPRCPPIGDCSVATRVLFLCAGNACRSQMAEGWARYLASHSNLAPWSFSSVGLEAHGLNPNAVRVMAEAGVDISAQTSDTFERFDLKQFEVVVTVCGNADEKCPILPATTRRTRWPLEDPAKLPVGLAEAGFRASPDDKRERVQGILNIFST